MGLEEERLLINQIDKQMAELFEARMKSVESVIRYKTQNNLPILDKSREEFVINKNLFYIKNERYKPYYEDFLKYTMAISRRYQTDLQISPTVGYQGTKGAYSHIALQKIFESSKERAYQTFEDVFKALISDEIAFGVLPFENSYTGEVCEVLDLLYKYDCNICKIYDLQIHHHLLGVQGADICGISEVYSHPQALSQCEGYFKAHDFTLIPYPNTALAAKYIFQTNDKKKAAVASIETAELYNLTVLAENINTSEDNTTRFVVISKKLINSGNRFSVMFTLNHTTGELAKIMQIISEFGFNMESIKSKSIHKLPWQYYFYVEIVGDAMSDEAKQMLEKLKGNCQQIKLLGVYTK